jgi:hypothetical protein
MLRGALCDAFRRGGNRWVPHHAIDHHAPIATAVELCGKNGVR